MRDLFVVLMIFLPFCFGYFKGKSSGYSDGYDAGYNSARKSLN